LLCGTPTRADETVAVDRLVGTRVGDFRLTNVVTGDETWFYGLAMGNRVFGQLLGMRQVKAAVLVFVSPGCPLGDKYLPRLGELAKAYEQKGVLFFGIAPAPAKRPRS
jgi:thiol-disulfide isomerase/thioredoxin